MDFGKLISAPVHAGQSVLRDLTNTQPEQDAARAQVMKMLAAKGMDISQVAPQPEQKPFELPGLNDALTPEAQQAKAEAEANGEVFQPGEDDFVDSGPHGYLHKKGIHDAFIEYEKELQANRPHIDYEGILKSRLADMANAPEEHRSNPLFNFAMAMGNPEHAAELVKTHDAAQSAKDEKTQQRWQELLDMKKDALEGSIKAAMAEGDARKVVSGKWLEQLAQIEKDKAAAEDALNNIGEKNAGALERVNARAAMAGTIATQRANAMLATSKVAAGSRQAQTILAGVPRIAAMYIKNGDTDDVALEKAHDWAHDQIKLIDASWNEAATPVTRSRTPGAAAPAAGDNEMDAEIKKMH
jgi:hypothetical protein